MKFENRVISQPSLFEAVLGPFFVFLEWEIFRVFQGDMTTKVRLKKERKILGLEVYITTKVRIEKWVVLVPFYV